MLATLVVGLVAGASGVLLVLLLHAMQHLAFGGTLGGPESSLAAVVAASPWRRLAALGACSLIAALGWWALDRFGRPLVPMKEALGPEPKRLPLVSTAVDAVLQILIAGLGSPLGREAAPRQLAAAVTDALAPHAGLSAEDRRVLVACAAGAGLAAVYNVPLSGTLFTLEVLLASFAPAVLVPAIATAGIATLFARLVLGDEVQYAVPAMSIGPSVWVWAVVAGPIFGVLARAFGHLTRAARSRPPRGPFRLAWCLPVFLALGVIAMRFPQLPGNGQAPTQLGLDGELGLALAAILLVLRFVAPVAALRAGASGGLLTPSLAVGALSGVLLGAAWTLLWPVPASAHSDQSAYALVGAAAFLSVSARMPLTAIALAAELTRAGHAAYPPILLAVAGAWLPLPRLLRKAGSRSSSALRARPASDDDSP